MWRPRQFESFAFLLVTMVAMLVAVPILGQGGEPRASVRLFITGIYLASLVAVSGRRRVLWIGLALGVPALVSEWLTVFTGDPIFAVFDALSSVLFMLFAAVTIIDTILRQQQVTADTILGGICAYLLLGILFTEVCALVEFLQPGSYALWGEPFEGSLAARANHALYSRFLYYSFVTLTTLGYGDVTPLTPVARSLAMVEAVMGQLYLAIFVARLVGQYIASRSST